MKWWLCVIVAGFVWGCATYRPAPLEPAKAEQQFESQTLDNPSLCDYVNANLRSQLPSCPSKQLDLAALTLVGFYYGPDLVVAETRLEQAEAAVTTAGGRPNPTLGLGPQYSVRSIPNVTPWAIGSFNLSVPIETAGKRGYRIARAERLTDAARLSLGQAAWAVRSRIRAALLGYLLAIRESDLAYRDEAALGQTVQLMSERLQAGEAAQPELNLALGALSSARVKAAEAQARMSETRNALAAALGVPVEALNEEKPSWPSIDQPPNDRLLSPAEIQRASLLNRLDLRGALAQFAAADEALKLEIAKQYPDVNLLGGYSWEGGENLFDLGPSMVLPILNQNQGPIAEAEAARKNARAEFLAMQAAIIAQANGALLRYRGAFEALNAADAALKFQTKRLDQAQQAYAVGEDDRLTLAQAQLQRLAAEQAFLQALGNTQSALGALEDSVERPLDSGDIGSFSFPAKDGASIEKALR
jgi:cobalt-zinc-cadmium efflux system outer membrane protein